MVKVVIDRMSRRRAISASSKLSFNKSDSAITSSGKSMLNPLLIRMAFISILLLPAAPSTVVTRPNIFLTVRVGHLVIFMTAFSLSCASNKFSSSMYTSNSRPPVSTSAVAYFGPIEMVPIKNSEALSKTLVTFPSGFLRPRAVPTATVTLSPFIAPLRNLAGT